MEKEDFFQLCKLKDPPKKICIGCNKYDECFYAITKYQGRLFQVVIISLLVVGAILSFILF